MSQSEKIQENKAALLSLHKRGLTSEPAYKTFLAEGGHWRRQDFQAAYRMIEGKKKAAYNIGGAKRADVKVPKVEKYQKKAARLKAKAAAKAKKKGGKKARTPARKKKEAARKKGGETGYEIGGVDVSTTSLGQKVDYKDIQTELTAHGIRVFDKDGGNVMRLAKSGKTIHLYGMAVYEPSKDTGGRAVGVARVLINKVKKSLGVKQE